jgi:hypothetical protein
MVTLRTTRRLRSKEKHKERPRKGERNDESNRWFQGMKRVGPKGRREARSNDEAIGEE